MNPRELQDADGTRWTCVQALAGVDGEAARRAAALTANSTTVTVVCTPSGGERTVHVQLEHGWQETTPDHALLAAIAAAQHE